MWEVARVRISTSISEALVLTGKRVACPLQVGGEVLPQVEEFKNVGVLFTCEAKMERELSQKAKFSLLPSPMVMKLL